jgi:curved DNA-binding protein CbpA
MGSAYEVLGLRPGATQEEVKLAYHDLVNVWHPDRFLHDEKLKSKAEAKLKEINAAYECLIAGSLDESVARSQRDWSVYASKVEELRRKDNNQQEEKLKSWVSLIILVIAGAVLSMLLYTVDNTMQKAEPRKTLVAIVSS